MRRLRGSIADLDGETVLEGVEVVLTERQERGGAGMKSWQGHFRKDPGAPFLDPGENYVLHLEDGREGELMVASVSPGDAHEVVRFRSAGSLEKPGD